MQSRYLVTKSIPNFLSHYYWQGPFQTLSDLAAEDVSEVIARLAAVRSLPFRLASAEYLPLRRQFEQRMRQAFVAKGGRPRREYPHYMILGRSPYWETIEPHVVVAPLVMFPSEIISFTYADSFYTFSDFTLRGRPIPPQPHRNTIYRLEELEQAVREFGLPPGYANAKEEFDTYIEAQIWADEPLLALLPPAAE